MSNVVLLDRAATAKQQSAQVRRRYEAARIEPELRAIRMNRMARLSRTRRFWLTMCLMSAGLGVLFGYQLTAPSTLNRPVTRLSQEVTDKAKNTIKEVTLAPSMPTTSVVAVMSNPVVASQQSMTTTLSESSSSIVITRPERLPIGSPSAAQQGLQKLNTSNVNTPPNKTQEQTPKAGVYEMVESRSTARPSSTLGNRNNVNVVTIDAQKTEPINSLKVIGVPVDGILNIDVAGAVRSYKVGDRLPDGKVLIEANADKNTYISN